MHYTSWDRSDTARPRLLEEDGPRQLAVFSSTVAVVGDHEWQLEVDKASGAQATTESGSTYRLRGDLRRASTLEATIGDAAFKLVGETSRNWIIDDAQGNKVAQFSSVNRGVRKAICEFEEPNTLSEDEIVALSWFSRLVMEQRLANMGMVLIATLIVLSIVAIAVFVF